MRHPILSRPEGAAALIHISAASGTAGFQWASLLFPLAKGSPTLNFTQIILYLDKSHIGIQAASQQCPPRKLHLNTRPKCVPNESTPFRDAEEPEQRRPV